MEGDCVSPGRCLCTGLFLLRPSLRTVPLGSCAGGSLDGPGQTLMCARAVHGSVHKNMAVRGRDSTPR
ncbi:hypothetical protein B0O80DRAFT_444377 [Mortierella sp. GBAus27b]|nr:hypothetical protein B0O80DRAFT_444377 [Mortierella sp. GBAus27b]